MSEPIAPQEIERYSVDKQAKSTKYMNGKKYFLDNWYENKTEAIDKAQVIRKMGHHARVEPREGGFLVYYKLE